jgi:hypothetical protein
MKKVLAVSNGDVIEGVEEEKGEAEDVVCW